jgi:hypothetical protein
MFADLFVKWETPGDVDSLGDEHSLELFRVENFYFLNGFESLGCLFNFSCLLLNFLIIFFIVFFFYI